MDESMPLEEAYHKGLITIDQIPDEQIREKLQKEKQSAEKQPAEEKQVSNKQLNALRRGHNTQKKKRKEEKIEKKQQSEYIEERIDNILKILDENNGSLEEKALLQRFIYLYKRRTRNRT